ncbi:malonyl-CoA decarboxylase [Rhodospirillum rubrum]|nr:malonyl-CoA decarboxylase [Rhodospirillum rubrum]QXG81987.1 malonyl-CoA decarboxylase [Rhodospirillum rubrum]
MMTDPLSANPGFFLRLSALWRDIAGGRGTGAMPPLSPGLDDDDMGVVRQQLNACLEGKGGVVSAHARAASLGRAYLSLNEEGRIRFLGILAREFSTDHQAVIAAARALIEASSGGDTGAILAAETELGRTLTAPRRILLTQFNALPEGVKFLVDLRGELLTHIKTHPELRPLERDLRDLLTAWFDVGFLDLERITWESSASFLEKIITYEAVHAIQSWDDLKNRLDHDRRLYAFVHPRMPHEPLIFVEVALVNGISGTIGDLLDLEAPLLDPAQADTAIFYSISNAQSGLAGISFGNFLIKRVVETLRREFPGLKTFSTLSPIPGFRRWLDGVFAEGDIGPMSSAERKALRAVDDRGAKGALKRLIETDGWLTEEGGEEAVKGPLMRLRARYLAVERRLGSGEGVERAYDPVAHFHLTNGARVERINWRGDLSANGLRQSMGMMVNYLYKLDEIEKNHEAYQGNAVAAVSGTVKTLLKA